MVRVMSAFVSKVMTPAIWVAGLLWLASPVASAAVIMMYHHVDESTPAVTSVTPAQFAEHLAALQREGFQVVRLDTLLARVADGLPATARQVAITFDDAYRSIYDNALPLLEKYGWQATVFINTDGVGRGSQALTVPMLRDMQRRGHLLANHSRSHAHLVRRRRGESKRQWRHRVQDEIQSAAAQLQQWLGSAPPPWLAYPYGEHNGALRALLKEQGLLGFAQHSGAIDGQTDWQNIPRVAVNQYHADWASLRDKLLALPLPVMQTRPVDGVTDDARPLLRLTLPGDWRQRGLNCFVSGRAMTPVILHESEHSVVTLASDDDVAPGRSRYTCTAPAAAGRYYWYSWLWMRRGADGQWYDES